MRGRRLIGWACFAIAAEVVGAASWAVFGVGDNQDDLLIRIGIPGALFGGLLISVALAWSVWLADRQNLGPGEPGSRTNPPEAPWTGEQMAKSRKFGIPPLESGAKSDGGKL